MIKNDMGRQGIDLKGGFCNSPIMLGYMHVLKTIILLFWSSENHTSLEHVEDLMI